MPVLALMLSGLVLAGGMLGYAVLLFGRERDAGQRHERLAALAGRARPLAARPMDAGGASLTRTSFDAADARMARWLPGAATIRTELARTGRSIALAHYAAGMVLTAGFAFTVATVLIHSLVAAAAIAIALGIMLPRILVRRMGRRRLARFTQQFPEAIDLIVRALRAGLPLSDALVTIAQESPDPVGIEFRRAAGALTIGRSIEEALWEMERHIDSAELRFFVISIATQVQTGGNLGETLANLADILRQRAQMRMKVKAMTGEARASATVLGSLPFVIALLMSFTNPSYIAPLFSDPRGLAMLGVGGVMLIIGVGSMAKLVSFEI